jgi:hypothetical protein
MSPKSGSALKRGILFLAVFGTAVLTMLGLGDRRSGDEESRGGQDRR